jgi:hypothetical protein
LRMAVPGHEPEPPAALVRHAGLRQSGEGKEIPRARQIGVGLNGWHRLLS